MVALHCRLELAHNLRGGTALEVPIQRHTLFGTIIIIVVHFFALVKSRLDAEFVPATVLEMMLIVCGARMQCPCGLVAQR